ERTDVAREVLDLEQVTGLLAEVRDDVLLGHAPVAADLDADDGRALRSLRLALRDVDDRPRGSRQWGARVVLGRAVVGRRRRGARVAVRRRGARVAVRGGAW